MIDSWGGSFGTAWASSWSSAEVVQAPAPSQGGRAVYMAPYVHMPSPLPGVDSRGDEEVALLHVIS